MSRRLLSVGMTIVASGACVAIIAFAPAGSPERVLAAFLLVLVFPGIGLSDLVPVVNRRQLLVVPALSVTAVILDSAGLSLVGVRLDIDSWSISLAAIAVVGHLLSLTRETGGSHGRSLATHRVSAPALVAGLSAAGLLAGAAVVTARSVERQHHNDRFTQLWALPDGQTSAIEIGVYNHQGVNRTYRLEVSADGVPLQSEQLLVASGRSLTLKSYRPVASSAVRISIVSTGPGTPVNRWVQLRFPPPPRPALKHLASVRPSVRRRRSRS